MRILVDMTAVSDLDIESQDLKNLIQLNSQRNQGGAQLEPTAFIWTSRFAQVLESTFRFLADNLPIQLTVTTTILDGIRWLGLGDQADEVRQVRARLESAAKAS